MEKNLKNLIAKVNKSLIWYKKGGWVDCRRTPTSGINMVDTLEDFIEARFNRECWEIPELNEACELLDGRLFSCSLIGPDEAKKKFKQAVITIARPEDIENPSEDLKKALDVAYNYLGGNKIKFNSVKVKVKYEISNE